MRDADLPAGRRGRAKNRRKTGKLPRNQPDSELIIERLGGRGDGIGRAAVKIGPLATEETLIVPAALPGERVRVRALQRGPSGIRAELLELLDSSPDRIEPDCPNFPDCGGCQLRHMTETAYQDWKISQLNGLLAKAGLQPGQSRPPFFAGPHSRRRVRLAAKQLASGLILGFQQRFSNHIIEPISCRILHPQLARLLAPLADMAAAVLETGKQAEIQVNLLREGADVLLVMDAGISAKQLAALPEMAAAAELARLSITHPDSSGRDSLPTTLYAPQPPTLSWAGAAGSSLTITPPAGAFLQASIEAEQIMQKEIADWLDGAGRVADLFSGCGALSLPLLASGRSILAVDLPGAALEALQQAGNQAGLGTQLQTQARDLEAAPLQAEELAGFQAVIMDPPRSGASKQAAELARSAVPKIMMVSCNPHSFVRDAGLLAAAGYVFDWVKLIDQFDRASHSEVLAGFSWPEQAAGGRKSGILI